MNFEFGVDTDDLEIAGYSVKYLLWDMDEAEAAVHKLALYPQFYDHFYEAFDVINLATSFWLDEGSYTEYAESTIQSVFHLRDVIVQEASFMQAASLPRAVRNVIGVDHPATDSQLTATVALVYSVEAVEILANWLFNLEIIVEGIDAELIEQLKMRPSREYLDLVERQRDLNSGLEIYAREQFAIRKGDAENALQLAGLYQQIENIDVSVKGFNVSSVLHDIVSTAFSSKASLRSSAAGKGNKSPDSVKQQESQDLKDRIIKSAKRHLQANAQSTKTELVKALHADGIASKPTIRKYVDEGNFFPKLK